MFLGEEKVICLLWIVMVFLKWFPNVFLPFLVVNSGKITRNLGVFVLFLPCLSGLALVVGAIHGSNRRIFESGWPSGVQECCCWVYLSCFDVVSFFM